ncbi:exodeoxyribonuclease VII small subunit [Actinomyces faecalis]|uniref:exodeoxyribonuclease VII small subunit n=1 Tax=Actinomyces faecalis TaxID=2722820 RepID=UPI00155725F7|nr:exodeoxyribonuclease VII small subunit [Actinomyces faecalis]
MSLTPDSFLATGDASADVASLSYEQAREELVGVVQRLEAGQVPLEDALSLWERGEALAARCQAWLDEARRRLDAVAQREDSHSGADH